MGLVHNGSSYFVRGFLQPGKSMSQRSAMKKTSPLGEVFGETYLFIGSVDCDMAVGDTLTYDRRNYDVRQVEIVRIHEEAVYLWGLCVLRGGVNDWD